MRRSYFSERTGEYRLVPKFVELASGLGKVSPFYLWRTREGNAISAHIHGAQVVRLVAVFARRPKRSIGDDVLEGKVNFSVIEAARSLEKAGIATVAGFVPALSIFDIWSCEIHWLDISRLEPRDHHFSLTGSKWQWEAEESDCRIRESQLARLLFDRSRSMTWQDAIEAAKAGVNDSEHGGLANLFRGIGGYKPVFFAIC